MGTVSTSPAPPVVAGERLAAYTTMRSDIVALVPRAAMSILDAGCSNGALGAALRAEVPGRTVDGIEFDAALARDAQVRLDHVHCADLNRFDWMALGRDRYDCLVFADVLEHLLDPWRELRAAVGTLRPGGSVVVSLPNVRHVTALASVFVRGTFPRRERGIFDSTHLRWFTLKDARALLADAGLAVTAMDSALRLRDKGGGLANKITTRLCDPIRRFAPVREFLTYQFTLRAEKR